MVQGAEWDVDDCIRKAPKLKSIHNILSLITIPTSYGKLVFATYDHWRLHPFIPFLSLPSGCCARVGALDQKPRPPLLLEVLQHCGQHFRRLRHAGRAPRLHTSRIRGFFGSYADSAPPSEQDTN